MINKVRLIIPKIAIIVILLVFIFVLKIFDGLDVDSTSITLKGFGSFRDVYEYNLNDFNLYLLGFLVLIFTLVVLSKFDNFSSTSRKIELIVFVVSSVVLLFVANKYISSMGGICTLSIPAFCIVSIDSSDSIVWVLKGSMIAFIIYDALIFTDIMLSDSEGNRRLLLIKYAAPFIIVILLSLLFLNSLFYLLLQILLLIYLLTISIFQVLRKN